jgi:hypothetical protein
MIPPDVASSLRLILPDTQQAATNAQTQPVVAAQRIADILSDLVPGQRIFADIQALLPNGNYRAVVGQREITLALPFSAKAGDSLELEVAESDGKLTLAFVANRTEAASTKAGQESVSTTLSSAGKLIGNLMNGIEGEGKRAPPATLNGNQALIETMPKSALDIVPVLKQALSQSGMFYEAHQARWVAGQLPTEALRLEPQAKYSPAPIPIAVNVLIEPKITGAEPDKGSISNIYNARPLSLTEEAPQLKDSTKTNEPTIQPKALTPPLAEVGTANTGSKTEFIPQSQQSTQPGSPIPRELTPLVQQQLDGLATQNFAWQGQVWPGQKMWWEIGESPSQSRGPNGEQVSQWQTRLKLTLPMLGGVDAILQLRPGGEVGISVTTDSEASEAQLRESAGQLRNQFESAGLKLTKFLLQHDQSAE